MKTTFPVVLLLLGSLFVSVGAWERTYGGIDYDKSNSITCTLDGGFLIAGMIWSADSEPLALVCKLSSNGDIIWSAPRVELRRIEYANCIAQSYGNRYIIGGSYGGVCKLAPNGDTLWFRIFGALPEDNIYAITPANDCGYIAVGASWRAGSDLWVLKFNNNGDTLWTRKYWHYGIAEAKSISSTPDGGYIIAEKHGWILKINENGDTLWTRSSSGNLNSIIALPDGGFIAAGSTYTVESLADLLVLRLSPSGDTIWTRTFGGDSADIASSIGLTPDGGYIVTGQTASFGAGSDDVWLLKLNSSGDTIWTRTFGGSSSDIANSIAITSDGGYIIAGQTESFGSGGLDAYVIKVDSVGNSLHASARSLELGWNLVSLPSGAGTIPVSRIRTDPVGSAVMSYWAWSGGRYVEAGTLSEGQPFWILATRPCLLYIE